MRLLFIINTPAQAYTWRHIIDEFQEKGHSVRILARDYGSTPQLLSSFGFQFDKFKSRGSRALRLLGALGHFQQCYELTRGFYPSMIVGFGLDAAVTARMYRKPCVLFVDDEHTYVQNRLAGFLASSLVTPNTFKKTLGSKHIRINSYKEMAYLHPDYFKPDPSVVDELGVKKDEKYVILRFNASDAVHDIGNHGFPTSIQLQLIKELGKYARVFLSPESNLSIELEKYFLPIPYNRIHHALYYAQMLVADTGTMTTEAAILGTPAVRYHTLVGRNDPRCFLELEQKYGLIYNYSQPEKALEKAVELIQRTDLKAEWAYKRSNLFKEKIDINQFMIEIIRDYLS